MSAQGAFAARMGIKLLEVCLSIHKGCFISDSSFVVKLVLTKIMIKAAKYCALPEGCQKETDSVYLWLIKVL